MVSWAAPGKRRGMASSVSWGTVLPVRRAPPGPQLHEGPAPEGRGRVYHGFAPLLRSPQEEPTKAVLWPSLAPPGGSATVQDSPNPELDTGLCGFPRAAVRALRGSQRSRPRPLPPPCDGQLYQPVGRRTKRLAPPRCGSKEVATSGRGAFPEDHCKSLLDFSLV